MNVQKGVNPIIYTSAYIAGAVASFWIEAYIYSGFKGRGYRLGINIEWFRIRKIAEVV